MEYWRELNQKWKRKQDELAQKNYGISYDELEYQRCCQIARSYNCEDLDLTPKDNSYSEVLADCARYESGVAHGNIYASRTEYVIGDDWQPGYDY